MSVKPYEKPEVIAYDSLKDITAGNVSPPSRV